MKNILKKYKIARLNQTKNFFLVLRLNQRINKLFLSKKHQSKKRNWFELKFIAEKLELKKNTGKQNLENFNF